MAEETRSGDAAPLVSGADIRTFLFADMRGYTRFTQEHGDDAASALAGQFADIVRETVPEFEGELLELRGDEALSVFRSARQALRASVELQRRLRTPTDADSAFPLGVGMGLDAGEAVPTQGGYRGAALNLAARLCALAKPGEILATESVAHLAHRVDGLRLLEGHSATLKGMPRPVRYVTVEPGTVLPPLPAALGAATVRRRWRYYAAIAVVAVLGVVALAVLRSAPTRRAAAEGIPGTGIVRVDAASGSVRALPLPQAPGAVYATGFGLGWLWVTTPRGLEKVNPRTGLIAGGVALTSGGGPVAVGPSHVYVTGLGIGSNNVQVINPETVAVESVIPTQPFNHSQSEFYILTGFGSLWIWGSGGTDCCNGRMFWRIDPATGRVRGRWLSPNDNGSYTGLQNQVAVGSGSVWLLRNGRLLRINPTTNGASGGLKVDASMVTAEGGAVWAVSRLGAVTEINPALYPALTATIWTHQFSKMLVDNVAAGDGQVWLMDGTNQRLTEINATSRHVSHTRLPIQTSGLLTIGHDAAWIGYPPGYGESPIR